MKKLKALSKPIPNTYFYYINPWWIGVIKSVEGPHISMCCISVYKQDIQWCCQHEDDMAYYTPRDRLNSKRYTEKERKRASKIILNLRKSKDLEEFLFFYKLENVSL